MFGFIGKIVSGIAVKIIVLVIVVVGGRYAFVQVGGVPGVMALMKGEPLPATASQPITAGLGGFMGALGFGESAPSDHYEQQGRISRIEVECRLSRQANGKLVRTPPMPCNRARQALTHQQYADFTLNEARTATYIYYDMDGINTLTGKADARRGQKVGDVIRLRVNRDDPRRSTPI